MICPNCGNQIPNDSAFCPFCGATLGAPPQYQQPQYQQPQYQQPQYQQPPQQYQKPKKKVNILKTALICIVVVFLLNFCSALAEGAYDAPEAHAAAYTEDVINTD